MIIEETIDGTRIFIHAILILYFCKSLIQFQILTQFYDKISTQNFNKQTRTHE